MKKADVVIIGSGISALTSALLLAQKGKKVILLEQHAKPGGYMHCFQRFGELFDTGAHYLGSLEPGQPFHTLLSYMGIFDASLFARLNEKAFDLMYFPKGQIAIPQGYDALISELSATFPNEKSAIRAYYSKIQDVCKFFPTYHYSDATQIEYPTEALEVSLKAVVESLTTNPALQSVFYSYCSLHGVLPDEVAFGFHAIVTDSLMQGAYGLNGGGDALTKIFVDKIKSHGGEVLNRHKVVSLKVEDRVIKQVVTENGEVFEADWVISSAHPKTTFQLLSDRQSLTPALENRLRNLKESDGIFGIYTTFKENPGVRPDRNHYFFQSDDPKAMFAKPQLTEPPAVVFMSSPKRHWSEAEKKFPMSLHAPGPFEWFMPWREERFGRRSDPYKAFKNEWTHQIFSAVNRYESGFMDKVDQHLSSSPLTHLHFNGSEEGSSYGVYHSIQNTGARAFGPRTKVLNLLLTGQSCLFPGLLGAATSALRTAGHIVGIKPMLQELKELGSQ